MIILLIFIYRSLEIGLRDIKVFTASNDIGGM